MMPPPMITTLAVAGSFSSLRILSTVGDMGPKRMRPGSKRIKAEPRSRLGRVSEPQRHCLAGRAQGHVAAEEPHDPPLVIVQRQHQAVPGVGMDGERRAMDGVERFAALI